MTLPNLWKVLSLSFLPCLLLFPSRCRADAVTLSNVNNDLYNAFDLRAHGAVSDSFTLDQATEVLSISTGIRPEEFGTFTGNNWQVMLLGPTYFAFAPGASSWSETNTELILPAGNYTLSFMGGDCLFSGEPSCSVAGIDYYIALHGPMNYTEIGGTMTGPFGFTLNGQTVPTPAPAPEPTSWILLGTALLLAIPVRKGAMQRL